MGTSRDDGAVVDEQLPVTITSGNTNAASIMTGEQESDMILGRHAPEAIAA